MKQIVKFMAAGALLATTGLSLWGAPARRDVFTVTQPDGTTLQVCKVGDEYKHYLLTEDGKVLTLAADGTYCYASLGVNGILKSTGVKAVDAHMRSALPADALDITDKRLEEAATAVRRAPQKGMGLNSTSFPRKGSPKALVILVQYQNVKFTVENPYEYFYALLNQEGYSDYGATGSCRDYFRDNSMGQFSPEFDVYGPVTLSKRRSYYGGNDMNGNDKNPGMMVVEAVKELDPDVDFSQYDTDGDGYVDNVYIFYAGTGEGTSNESDAVWSHSDDLSLRGLMFEVDGVKINHYACSNEWESGQPVGIGVFTHEFGHVLGLPDLYHTQLSTTEYTPNVYSVMDYGLYNNLGRTPTGYSIYERNAMGWMDLEVIDSPANCRLDDIKESNHGYIIPTERENEFFLFENRQQTGWDTYIPGHGMLVWHIDFDKTVFSNNRVNNDASHLYVDIEEAAGYNSIFDKDILASYTFPGTGKITSFTDDTRPSMRSWSGQGQNLPITGISEKDGVITFAVAGGGLNAPVPAQAADIEKDEKYFVASWQPVEGATDYEVTVITADVDYEVLQPYENYSTGGKTSLRIDNVKDGCINYLFKVRALDGTRKSMYSPSVLVTIKNTGIDAVAGNDAPVEYFDMLGRKVERPIPGTVMIERRGSKVSKVIINH